MSSNDDSDAPLANVLLTKHTKSGRLLQLPQSCRPEGTPPLQCWAPSPIIIESSPEAARCKVKSADDKLAELTSVFKRQCQSAPATDVASVFCSRSVHGEDMPRNGADSRSEGSESNSSEGSSDMEENNSDNKSFSAANIDRPAMRQASKWHNWGQFNVPAEQLMGGRPNHDDAQPNSPRVHNEHSTTSEGPAWGSIVTSSLSSGLAARRDLISLYISLEGADGEEFPHIEYDVSVLRVSIGEALMQILDKGGRTARALKQMDHSQLTVSTSTHPLHCHEGSGDNLSFQEIAALDQVLSQDSSNYSTSLHSCRECTETLIVIQETELSRSKLYVIYIHRTASDMVVPVASGATLGAGAPAAAITDWQTWDSMFLPTIHSLSPLFDQLYNELFKIYLAVHLLMALADNITSDKKAMSMGSDG